MTRTLDDITKEIDDNLAYTAKLLEKYHQDTQELLNWLKAYKERIN